MYHTGRDPWSGKRLFVEKTEAGRELQKKILVVKNSRLGYEDGAKKIKKEGKSWEKTRTSKKIPRRNLPKH